MGFFSSYEECVTVVLIFFLLVCHFFLTPVFFTSSAFSFQHLFSGVLHTHLSEQLETIYRQHTLLHCIKLWITGSLMSSYWDKFHQWCKCGICLCDCLPVTATGSGKACCKDQLIKDTANEEFSLSPGRPTRNNSKSTDSLFPGSNNVFLPMALKKTVNRSGFERKENSLHSDFSSSFMQKSQIIRAEYNHVENKMAVWKTEYCYQLGAVNKADGNFFTSVNF